MSWIRDFGDFWHAFVEPRFPFHIKISGVRDVSHPERIVCVTLINKTKDLALSVRAVRIHFGSKFYNHAFVLLPWETVHIPPKSSHLFSLSTANPQTQIRRTSFHKTLPKPDAGAYPTFSSGADLFRAIANGKKRDSWIEVDFNEFSDRRFRRGRIKPLFHAIISQGPRF